MRRMFFQYSKETVHSMGVIRHWICMCLLAASAAASSPQKATVSHAGNPAPTNVVVITLDTTRADRMGFLGSKRGLTPNLDALAKQSVVFTRAYSQAPLTSPSHATILSGTYPQFHQVLDFPMPLTKDIPWAPDILHAKGYQTAAFLASLALDPTGGAPGFDRGFDLYDSHFSAKEFGLKDRYHTIERRGGEVVSRAEAWLNEHPKGPFFMWVHLYDAHDPYDPPEPFKTRYAKTPYDGEIAYVDSVVGKLLTHLKSKGVYENTVIAVMADHGEALGAHGEDTHGIFIYDETVHVPLVIKLPRAASAGKRIDNRVELIDVMPTVLQELNVEIPAAVQGQSLLDLIKAPTGKGTAVPEAWRDRPAYSQADYPHVAYGWSALQAMRTGKYLYVQAPKRELYDQAADPKEEHNVAGESTAVADALGSRIEAFRQKTTNQREFQKVVVDPSTQEKLAALGYVGSGSAPKADASGKEADPKDKIETANRIRRLNTSIEEQRWADAIPVLQQLIAQEPTIAMLYFKLGGCYMNVGDLKSAIPALRKAVELDPAFIMAQVNLSKALMQSQDFAGAVPVLEGIVAKVPHLTDAHIFLETAYARTNRVTETIKECKIVLEAVPDHYRSHLNLGRSLAKSGDTAAAIPELQKASTLRPELPGPHIALADIYDTLGKKDDAARERAEGQRLAKSLQSKAEPE